MTRSTIRLAKAVERRSKASDQMPGNETHEASTVSPDDQASPALVDLMERSTGAWLDGFFCGRNS